MRTAFVGYMKKWVELVSCEPDPITAIVTTYTFYIIVHVYIIILYRLQIHHLVKSVDANFVLHALIIVDCVYQIIIIVIFFFSSKKNAIVTTYTFYIIVHVYIIILYRLQIHHLVKSVDANFVLHALIIVDCVYQIIIIVIFFFSSKKNEL